MVPTPDRLIDRDPRPLPDDALKALQQAITVHRTQVAVAALLGVSPSAVNQLLKGHYRGDVDGMAQRIRGAFLRASVTCPVLGEITTKVCLDQQSRPMAFTNPTRAALARACPKCPHRKGATS
ncbi:MAG: hypothetical protein IIZ92_00095 [Aquincola sp.]|nr:hypothetical protein [Aquincola sp.]